MINIVGCLLSYVKERIHVGTQFILRSLMGKNKKQLGYKRENNKETEARISNMGKHLNIESINFYIKGLASKILFLDHKSSIISNGTKRDCLVIIEEDRCN